MKLIDVRRRLLPHGAEIFCLTVILIIACFFLFYQIPKDFGDDAISSGIVAEVINQGHRLGLPASQLFGNLASASDNRLLSANGFEVYGFALPLWHFLLSVMYSVFGASVLNTLVLTSLIGLLTVILVYYLGKEMYGRVTGLFSAILLSGSLLFLVIARSGSGLAALIPLTFSSVVYLVYAAHSRTNRCYLWASGIAMGLAFFDADSPVFLLVPVLILFLFWNLDFSALSFSASRFQRLLGATQRI